MTLPLKGLRIAVAGAGVFGLSLAASAARRGAGVVVFDPAGLGDNASGVAAGMVSPGLEAALEGGDDDRHELFRRAYAAWPRFAADLRLPLTAHAAGAILLGETVSLTARLEALDIETRPVGAPEVRALQPLYGGDGGGLFIPDDGRVDPAAVLDALARTVRDHGGRLVAAPLAPNRQNTTPQGFDRLVIATGYGAKGWAELAPELALLRPIKGHILHYALPGRGGATLRSGDGYLVPQAAAVAFGATMEAARADLAVDVGIAASLHAAAVALAPALAQTARTARTGIRATTPDGLPLVGASEGGPILAVGARRNGWLLAPLVAEAAMAALAGEAPAAPFDPARFGA